MHFLPLRSDSRGEREEGAEMQPSAPCEFWRARALLYNELIRIIFVEEMVLVGFLRGVLTAALGSSSTNSSVLPQAAMSATCLPRIPAGGACGVQQEELGGVVERLVRNTVRLFLT